MSDFITKKDLTSIAGFVAQSMNALHPDWMRAFQNNEAIGLISLFLTEGTTRDLFEMLSIDYAPFQEAKENINMNPQPNNVVERLDSVSAPIIRAVKNNPNLCNELLLCAMFSVEFLSGKKLEESEWEVLSEMLFNIENKSGFPSDMCLWDVLVSLAQDNLPEFIFLAFITYYSFNILDFRDIAKTIFMYMEI